MALDAQVHLLFFCLYSFFTMLLYSTIYYFSQDRKVDCGSGFGQFINFFWSSLLLFVMWSDLDVMTRHTFKSACCTRDVDERMQDWPRQHNYIPKNWEYCEIINIVQNFKKLPIASLIFNQSQDKDQNDCSSTHNLADILLCPLPHLQYK